MAQIVRRTVGPTIAISSLALIWIFATTLSQGKGVVEGLWLVTDLFKGDSARFVSSLLFGNMVVAGCGGFLAIVRVTSGSALTAFACVRSMRSFVERSGGQNVKIGVPESFGSRE